MWSKRHNHEADADKLKLAFDKHDTDSNGKLFKHEYKDALVRETLCHLNAYSLRTVKPAAKSRYAPPKSCCRNGYAKQICEWLWPGLLVARVQLLNGNNGDTWLSHRYLVAPRRVRITAAATADQIN